MISLFLEQKRPMPPAPLWHSVTLGTFIVLPMLVRPGGHGIFWTIRQDVVLSDYVLCLLYMLYAGFAIFGFVLNGADPIAFFRAQWPKDRSPWKELVLGLGVGFLGIALSIVASLLVRVVSGPPASAIERDVIPKNGSGLVAELITGCVAGFSEEVVYRNYFFQQISFWTGRVGIGLVLQSILFGLAHGPDYELAEFFTAISCGLLFGWVAFKRKSLVPAIVAHAWLNCIIAVVTFILARS